MIRCDRCDHIAFVYLVFACVPGCLGVPVFECVPNWFTTGIGVWGGEGYGGGCWCAQEVSQPGLTALRQCRRSSTATHIGHLGSTCIMK